MLTGAAEIRESKITEAHNDQITADPTLPINYANSFSEFGNMVKDVFSNPTYIFLTLFTSCDNFIIAGFTAFGPKFIQYTFSMSAAVAGGLFGNHLTSSTFCQFLLCLAVYLQQNLLILIDESNLLIQEP